MFTQSKVPQQLAPTPIFQAGAEFTLDGSPFLPAATQQVLSDALGSGVDSDGDGIDDTATAFVRRRLVEVGPRISDDKYTNFQLLAGVRGDIGETGWTYDVYVSEGEVSNSKTQSGNVNCPLPQALRCWTWPPIPLAAPALTPRITARPLAARP